MENTTTENTTVTPIPTTTKTRVSKAKVEVNGQILTFAFANGASRVVDVASLPMAIVTRLQVHGAEQKLRDCYAGAESADQAVGYFDKVLDSLKAGSFNVKGEGKGEEDSIDKLVKAVTNAYLAMGKDTETASAKGESIRAYDKAKRAQVRSIPAVAVELAKLKTSTMSLDDI